MFDLIVGFGCFVSCSEADSSLLCRAVGRASRGSGGLGARGWPVAAAEADPS